MTTIPSTDSNVAVGARRAGGRAASTGTAAGSALPGDSDVIRPPAADVADDLGHAEELVDLTADLDEVAGGDRAGRSRRQNTNRPSDVGRVAVDVGVLLLDEEPVGDVAGRVNVDVTMPSTIDVLAVERAGRRRRPGPSEIRVIGSDRRRRRCS